MKISDLAIIEPDDILLVDFGKSTIRCRVQGKHPAFVVYVSDRRKTDSQMLVIPMFRSQSKGNEDMDIRVTEWNCRGLKNDHYVNPTNLQKVDRYHVVKKIGHVEKREINSEIAAMLMKVCGTEYMFN